MCVCMHVFLYACMYDVCMYGCMHACARYVFILGWERSPGKITLVFFGPDRTGGPTEVSSMNRNFDDLFASDGRKSFLWGLNSSRHQGMYVCMHVRCMHV
jgi:hypothetical protein